MTLRDVINLQNEPDFELLDFDIRLRRQARPTNIHHIFKNKEMGLVMQKNDSGFNNPENYVTKFSEARICPLIKMAVDTSIYLTRPILQTLGPRSNSTLGFFTYLVRQEMVTG